MLFFFSTSLDTLLANDQMKLYVAQEAIELQNNAIIIKIEQGLLPVTAIHIDQDGYFVLENEIFFPEAPENTESVAE